MSSVPLSSGQKKSLASAAQAYNSQLADDAEAQAYLESRGLSGPASETLRLGVVRSPRPEHTRMAGRLAIPYIGPKGNVYDIRFRCIQNHDCKEESCPKYLGSDGVETRMFNTRALVAPTDYIFVTEGELDAATLVTCGWPAVGIPGANGWKKHYPRMLGGFSQVVLVADGDDAGQKLASTFRKAMPTVGRVILCGQGQDVNSTYMTEGKEGLARLLKDEEDE